MRKNCAAASPEALVGGLEIRYQPQYSMTGNVCGLEASLRLNHPELGSIAAERFLPVAEECGLIVPLGNWLLDQLCSQSLQWQRQRLTPPRISFAISALQFLHADFAAQVQSTVTEHGLDPRMIELIVTESTVMRNRPEVAFQMRSLAAQGVNFAVADFGTSYSCLSHLHQLPVSTLRIDCSFVERISDPNWNIHHCAGHYRARPRTGFKSSGRRGGSCRPDGMPAHFALRLFARTIAGAGIVG